MSTDTAYEAAREAHIAALAEYHAAVDAKLGASSPRAREEASARLHRAEEARVQAEAAWYAAYEAKRLADAPWGTGPIPGLFF